MEKLKFNSYRLAVITKIINDATHTVHLWSWSYLCFINCLVQRMSSLFKLMMLSTMCLFQTCYSSQSHNKQSQNDFLLCVHLFSVWSRLLWSSNLRHTNTGRRNDGVRHKSIVYYSYIRACNRHPSSELTVISTEQRRERMGGERGRAGGGRDKL